MPDTSLPALQLWDPNGFTNALAAGVKMRQTQNESDRLAAKDEAAAADANALSTYGKSARTQEDRDRLWATAPGKAMAIEKNTREAELADAQAKQAKLTWAKANHELLVNGAATVIADPTRETATMVLDSLEAQGGDVTVARMQLQNATDQGIKKVAQGWGMNAQQIETLARNERKDAEPPKPQWDSYNGRYVTPPAAGGQPQAGAGPEPTTPPAQPKRPTMVDPGGSGYTTAKIKEQIDRLDRGEALSPEFAGISSREGLVTLLQAQTDLENAQGGAATPPPGAPTSPPPTTEPPAVPPPVGGQPPPGQPAPPPAVPTTAPSSPPPTGPFRSRSELDAANFARQGAKDAEAQRVANERLRLQERGVVAQEARARPGGKPKLTEAQGKATAFAMRGTEANDQLSALELGSENEAPYRPDTGTQVGKWAGGMTGSPNRFLTPTGQKYEQAKLNFLTAVLRLESGAAIPPGEIETGNQQYFAMPGDSDEVLAQKKQNRNTAMKAMDVVAGPGRAGSGGTAAPAGAAPHADTSPALPKPVKVAPLKEFDAMPMPGEWKGKDLTDTKTGIRYYSDGRNWIKK
jgi:hypothetical protein